MPKQAALQACTRATKASKDNQDIKMIDDAATGKDSTVDVHLLPHSCVVEKLNIQAKLRYPQNVELQLQNLY